MRGARHSDGVINAGLLLHWADLEGAGVHSGMIWAEWHWSGLACNQKKGVNTECCAVLSRAGRTRHPISASAQFSGGVSKGRTEGGDFSEVTKAVRLWQSTNVFGAVCTQWLPSIFYEDLRVVDVNSHPCNAYANSSQR